MSMTDDYRILLKEKFPPKDDREMVYASIVLQLSEQIEKLEKQAVETLKAVRFLAKVLSDSGEDDAAEPTQAAAAEEPEQSISDDKTPFPADAKTAAAPNPSTGPVAEEDLTPNVSGTPGVNAAPIPQGAQKQPPRKNGTKDAVRS